MNNPVLRDTGAVVFNTGLTMPYGWAKLLVNNALSTNATTGATTGIPVAVGGFAFTKRDLGNPQNAYGSIVDHTLLETSDPN